MMKIRFCFLTGVWALAFSVSAARNVELFNDGWELSRDKKNWQAVEVPHDWAIAGPFDPKGDHNTGKLPWKGIGFYRKQLVVDKPLTDRRVIFDFDGVMCDGTLYVNDQPCGNQPYGYLGLRADATPYLFCGTNTLLVKADTTKLGSRWYPGAGMYRRVRKIECDNVFLDDRDVAILTPSVSKEKAELEIKGKVTSYRLSDIAAKVTVSVKSPLGMVVASGETQAKVAKCSKGDFSLKLSVDKPQLWQMKCPAALYTVVISLENGDMISFKTGFRSFKFDAKQGFILNGERVQLKGVCLHSDLGILGMAYNRSAMRRQLAIMRDMGANALRTSHNPPSPETLELCDEMGIFVWNECFDKWNFTSGRKDEPLEDYVAAKLREFVRRDRNHASVFIWSIGNEIPNGGGYAPGQEIWNMPRTIGTTAERCTYFRDVVRSEDPTRPVGIGSCFPSAVGEAHYENLDITGWNYRELYTVMYKKYPDIPVIYSESASALSEYGHYAEDLPTNKIDFDCAGDDPRVDSYDRNAAPWSDIPDREFARMERDKYVCGEFVWTGIDYLGEPTPYPVDGLKRKLAPEEMARSAYFGIYDLLAFPKDRAFLYRSYWNQDAFTLHIVPDHWTFPERSGKSMPVYVYTSGESAELFLNGVSLGRRAKEPNAPLNDDYYAVMPRYRLIWADVAWKPGELKAVAYDAAGNKLGEEVLRTAGNPVRVVLEPESEVLPDDEDDFVFVKVTLADENGTRIPKDRRRVNFKAEGAMEIVSVGNSNPRAHESFKAVDSHPLFGGRAGLVVRRKGKGPARLTASAPGLRSAVIAW